MQGRRMLVAVVCAVGAAGFFFFLPDPHGPEIAPRTITLDSSVVHDGGVLAPQQTCDGAGDRPPLTLSGVPDNAVTLAIVVDDPDAPEGTFTHWTVWNIDPRTPNVRSDELPTGAQEGTNSAGTPGWTAPCPPSGSTHRYVFSVYALDGAVSLAAGADVAEVRHALEGHVLAKGVMTVTATR